MTVNVLADRHHSGLYHSLQLLAVRLGWTLYTPIGMDWWNEWLWSFGRSTYGDDRLARQFLDAPAEPDGEFPDWPVPRVTLEEAKAMPWAFVIATAQDNETGFSRFAREMGATYVVQVGNTGQDVDWTLNPLALVSSEVVIEGRGVVYHQEMDPIAFAPPTSAHTAASFVNCMIHMGGCYDLMAKAQKSIPIDVYGIDGQEIVKPYSRLVSLMGQYGWGWHDKAQGDGFGHVIHSWAAVGRPLIGHASHYAGRMAAPFWQDGSTCIDLDRHSVAEAVEIVQGISEAEHYVMCSNIRLAFEEHVNYEAEAQSIADFLTAVPV